MTSAERTTLVAQPLPPLTLLTTSSGRARTSHPLPRLGRLLWLLAAFSLPALGFTFADLVHRAGEPGAMQAAAPTIPSVGAAVSTGVIPARQGVGVTPLLASRRDSRI